MRTRHVLVVALLAISAIGLHARDARADTKAEINQKSSAALTQLYAATPAAKTLAGKAKAVLVFPYMVKGGLIIGGQWGDGALRKGGKTTAYYRSIAASYGLQAGVQKFGYVLMFMDDESVAYLDNSDGWEIGVGPTIVVVDEGAAKTMTTTTAKKGVYAFIFEQRGLMAGLGVQGTKITKINPD